MDSRELFFDENHQVIPKPKTENSLQNQMVAMGKALVRARKNMSIEERKLLIMAMTKINWSKTENELVVCLSKLEISEVLNWKIDSSDRSTKVRNLATNLRRHSEICIDGKDKDEWDDGFLVPRIHSTKGDIYIHFAEQFRPLLENLTKDKDFVTIWANDVYGFDSLYAYLLFEDMRMHCDTRQTNWRTYSTKELKDLFGISKDGKGSYMHYDAKKGKEVFDRSNFEKKVLDVAIEEINRGQMIKILPFVGMEATPEKPYKLYEKIKKNGYVTGYLFKYNVFTRQVKADERAECRIREMTAEERADYDRTVEGAVQLEFEWRND